MALKLFKTEFFIQYCIGSTLHFMLSCTLLKKGALQIKSIKYSIHLLHPVHIELAGSKDTKWNVMTRKKYVGLCTK